MLLSQSLRKNCKPGGDISIGDRHRNNQILYGLQRSSICEGREFIACPARYKCPIENIKLKLTTKSQIETRQPEPLLMLAQS